MIIVYEASFFVVVVLGGGGRVCNRITKVSFPAVCLTGSLSVELLNKQRAFDLTKCLCLCNAP